MTVYTETEPLFKNYRRLAYLFLTLILLANFVGVIVPAGIGWDFANFYDTGRRVAVWDIANIYNPESPIDGQQPQGSMAFWGTPVSSLLYLPLGLLSPGTALVLFKTENMLAFLAALWLLFKHNRRFIRPGSESYWKFASVFGFLVLIFQPFWTIYRIGGQTTPTVLLLLVLSLTGKVGGRQWMPVICLVLAVLIKPGFIFILFPLVLMLGWKFIRNLALVFAGTGIFSILLMGWDIHKQFLLLMLRGINGGYPWFYNSSLYVTAENLKLLASPPVESALVGYSVLGVKIIVLLLTVYLLWRGKTMITGTVAREHFIFLSAYTFALLVSQTVWEHYLAVLFIPLCYIVASREHFSRRALAIIALIFLLSTCQTMILVNVLRYRFQFDTIPELIEIGLFKSSPLLLTIIFLVAFHKQLIRSHLAPAWSAITQVKKSDESFGFPVQPCAQSKG